MTEMHFKREDMVDFDEEGLRIALVEFWARDV